MNINKGNLHLELPYLYDIQTPSVQIAFEKLTVQSLNFHFFCPTNLTTDRAPRSTKSVDLKIKLELKITDM